MVNDQPTGGGGHDPQYDRPENQPYEPGPYSGQYPPNQYPPNQFPPNQYPPSQFPPNQYPPNQYPPGQYPPMGNQWGHSPQPTYIQPATLRVGEAISYGWKKFVANIGTWLAFMGLFAAILLVFYVALFAVTFNNLTASGAYDDPSYDATFVENGLSAGMIVGTSVAGIIGYFASALLVRGSLLELDGATPSFGSFWRLPNVGNLTVFAVVASVLNAVLNGALHPIIGIFVSFVFGIAIWFVLQFLLDRGTSAMGAVAANLRLLASSPGPLALLFMTLVALNLGGALLCGLGLILTVPVTMIATTYAYRVLTGGTVSTAP